jgi:hypothetical protein
MDGEVFGERSRGCEKGGEKHYFCNKSVHRKTLYKGSRRRDHSMQPVAVGPVGVSDQLDLRDDHRNTQLPLPRLICLLALGDASAHPVA